jgi:hypothetical protein
MPSRLLAVVALLCLSSALHAQQESPSRYQLYGGYSLLSNSLNGVTGFHQALNGWDVAFALHPWHNLRFKMDYAGYRGSNLGAPQRPYYIMGGGQYTMHIRRESLFGDALAGEAGANKTWAAGGAVGQSASFVAYLGGGLDTPLTRRIAFRVSGGYQYSYFELQTAKSIIPYTIPGLPTNFGRISSGLVWQF